MAKRKSRMDDMTVKAKDCYDPADYIMVHKDYYADLLYRATTRITIAPYKISADGIVTARETGGKHD